MKEIKNFTPEISSNFALIDFKACVKHSLFSQKDPDGYYDESGEFVNTAKFGFKAFIDIYADHLLNEQDYSPYQIIIAHDGGHEYRKTISNDYKANREKNKKCDAQIDEFDKLSDRLKKFLAYLGCTQLHVKGVEADDVLAHLVEKLSPNYPCSVYTVDADLLALANNNTTIWLKKKLILNSFDDILDVEDEITANMKGYLAALHDESGRILEDVKDNVWKYITLYKSLVGDSADGYLGIKGFGPAKWLSLVKDFDIDGLDELIDIVENRKFSYLTQLVEETGEPLLKKLLDNKNEWHQCWKLAKLYPELCWKPTKKGLTKINWYKRVPNDSIVKTILTKNDCEHFYKTTISELMPQKFLIDKETLEEGDIAEFTELCKESFVVGWDYETYSEPLPNGGINIVGSKIAGVSFCLGKNFQYAMYLTVGHKDSNNIDKGLVKNFIEAIPNKVATVAHNLQFETVVTATNLNLVVSGGYDTAVMSSYVDENESMGLKSSSLRELNYTQETYEEVLAKANAENMSQVTAEQVMSYGIDDSIVACHLYVLYWLRMQLEDCWEFYAENEPLFTKRTALSMIEGVNVDFDELNEIKEKDTLTIKTNKDKLRSLLSEHCTGKLNVKAAKDFVEADKEFIVRSTKSKLKLLELGDLSKKVSASLKFIEKLDECDDGVGKIYTELNNFAEKELTKEDKPKVIGLLCKLEVEKALISAINNSAYFDYKEIVHEPKFTPTVKNLNKVCDKLDLPEIPSLAVGKFTEWYQNLVGSDFDDEDDELELSEIQENFLTLLSNALPYLKADKREGSKEFYALQSFCCDLLEIKGKTEYSGTELNTGSSKQMQYLYYCMLGIPVRVRSKVQKGSARSDLGLDGSPATDVIAIDTALANDVEPDSWIAEALKCVKAIKECETRISLYCEAYPKLICPDTGKLHPSINSCGTVTRRPTGSAPNILQVSKHQANGIMRSVYKPIRDNHVIVAIDFSGQELRILASITRDFNLLSAYLGVEKTNEYLALDDKSTWEISTRDIAELTDVKDLHSNTGASIVHFFGLTLDDDLVSASEADVKAPKMNYGQFTYSLITKDDEYYKLANKVRKKPAKTTNFLMAYGGSAQSLSQKLIISEDLAESIVNATLNLYPGIEKGQQEAYKFAKTHGYVLTAYGNRRYANSDLFSKESGLVNRQIRQLFNSKIQGTAADILKVVIAEAERKGIWEMYDAVMMAPVYDEIVASVNIDDVYNYITDMVEIMNLTPPNNAVPMMAEASIGIDWQKQVELDEPFPSKERVDEVLAEILA